MVETETKTSIDNCYLQYVEGYLECTYNHKIGEECLMNQQFECDECQDYGYVEIMGDGPNFDFDVVGTRPCSTCAAPDDIPQQPL